MTNQLAKTKRRTAVQVAELGLQSAENYHQQPRSAAANCSNRITPHRLQQTRIDR